MSEKEGCAGYGLCKAEEHRAGRGPAAEARCKNAHARGGKNMAAAFIVPVLAVVVAVVTEVMNLKDDERHGPAFALAY